MQLLPQPQRASVQAGNFLLSATTHLVLQNAPPGALLYGEMLAETILQETGLQLPVVSGVARGRDIALCLDDSIHANRYVISITPQRARLCAGSEELLCNGVQTLCQLVQRHGALLPCLGIEDWPQLAARGYYQDISRGRIPTMASLKRTADLLCRYKINQWQLYIEHTYLFRDLSEVWRDDTPLTAQQVMELDQYCAARHIELVPSLATFGHMYKILSTKSYEHLAELPGANNVPFSFTYAAWHHTLNAADDHSLQFIEGLINEYRALFRTNKFNLCADETFDLGKGRGRPLAQQIGEYQLYLKRLGDLCDFVVRQGGVPMFWGDIMWSEPGSCALLTKEAICLNWGYLPEQREDEVRWIAESCGRQYVCPGVCAWNHWIPLFHNAYRNISVMASHGVKYGAIGLLNTDWGDYGHINDPRLSVPGILYGAALGWNIDPVPFDQMNEAISMLAYGDCTRKFVGAMVALESHEVFDWQHVVSWIEATDEPARQAVLAQVQTAQIPVANKALSAGCRSLLRAASALPRGGKEVVPVLLASAEGAMLWNEIALLLAGPLSLKQEGDAVQLASRLENWFYRYAALWRQISCESGLAKLTQIVARYADLLHIQAGSAAQR